MKLSKLTNSELDIEIKGVTADSRDVKAGFLFGSLHDDEFAKDAVEKGAVAISTDYSKAFQAKFYKLQNKGMFKNAQTVRWHYMCIYKQSILKITYKLLQEFAKIANSYFF